MLEERMRRRIREISVELCREMYGEDECPPLGTRLSRIEEEAVAVGDAIGREVMQSLLRRQAAQVPRASLRCPDCGGPCQRGDEDVGQKRLTRRGEVEWSEPEYYCPKCRRSFFPGAGRFGSDS
jgi:hypothetical protein